MTKLAAGLMGMAAIAVMASAAQAAPTPKIITPGEDGFTITAGTPGDPNSSLTAVLGDTITKKGAFIDEFQFTVAADGLGSGTLSTSTSDLKSNTNLDFTSITVNGTPVTITKDVGGYVETASLHGFTIEAGALNTIEVAGYSRGNGSFGGNATFIPTTSVPEIATWAMMILGFGVVGSAMRKRQAAPGGYRMGAVSASFA